MPPIISPPLDTLTPFCPAPEVPPLPFKVMVPVPVISSNELATPMPEKEPVEGVVWRFASMVILPFAATRLDPAFMMTFRLTRKIAEPFPVKKTLAYLRML